MQYDGFLAILGQEGDGDPGHDSILSVHCHATNFPRRGQVTFVIKGDLRRSGRSPAGFQSRQKPSQVLVYLIVRQSPALEKAREVSANKASAR